MKKKAEAVRRDDGWKGYVNWSPIAADRDKVVGFMGKITYVPLDYLLQLSESGYATSFGYDEKANCHRISVTGKGERCPNKGYTLSIRASTPDRCLGLAAYYIFVLCEAGDWLVDKEGEEIW